MWEEFEAECEARDLDPDLVWMARELLALEAHPVEELMPLVLGSLIALKDGSTRVPLFPGMKSPVDEVLQALGEIPDAAQYERLNELLKGATTIAGQEEHYRPLLVSKDWLYHQKTFHLERDLAELLAARIGPGQFSQGEAKEALSSLNPEHLSDEQQQAVLTAASSGLSIITGGPGTGKTTIILQLVQTLIALGVPAERISLAAPTGKAANRMSEKIHSIPGRPSPRTLHRLLEYSMVQRRFRRDRHNPLRQAFVIVDEASMIDLHLMRSLMEALGGAQLVLLGDADQLPSVESGTVLRDLMPTSGKWGPALVHLRQSFRQSESDPAGAAILETASAIQNGSATWEAIPELKEYGADSGGVHRLGDGSLAHLQRFVARWSDQHVFEQEAWKKLIEHVFVLEEGRFTSTDTLLLDEAFSQLAETRILCVTRKFARGSEAVNQAIQARYSDNLNGLYEDFGPGMPVMMLHNDYGRGLFNGDQGLMVLAELEDHTSLMAVFMGEDGYRAHHLNALRSQIDVAFAMTVHKAQGSEFDRVSLILPEEDLPLVTRENLYTALTRARRDVVILGSGEIFEVGVQRPVRRFSGVGEKLEALGAPQVE